MSGLLAKDASVTVKYTSEDLTAAKGNAGKLVLARYDRTDSGWTLLPTSVDKNAMTLTASTNRFSTWAVIAVQDGGGAVTKTATTYSPGPEPLLICGIIALVLFARSARKK